MCSGDWLELYGCFENRICTIEPLSKTDHLQYAVHLLSGSSDPAESADSGITGIWHDHPGIPAHDFFPNCIHKK